MRKLGRDRLRALAGPLGPPLNIAHRGARSLAPENTLAAIEKAASHGARMVELDVTLTKDERLLIIHDDTLERTSNAPQVYPGRQPWAVAEFAFEEVRALDFGGWFAAKDPFGEVAGGRVSERELEAYQGACAPSLEEALDLAGRLGLLLNLELKDQPSPARGRRLVELTLAAMEASGLEANVLVSSYNQEYLAQARGPCPALALGVLVNEEIKDPAELLAALDADSFHPWHETCPPGRLRELSGKGLVVLPWTVNDPVRLRQYLAAGAWGVFTDFCQNFPSTR